MLVRRLGARLRAPPPPPKAAASILFRPVIGATIPHVIYTTIPIEKEGYTVIHVKYQRPLIKYEYPRQILETYDALDAAGKQLLWAACVLYKNGGVCLLDQANFTHEETDSVNTVTVAAAGSFFLRDYILRTFMSMNRAGPSAELSAELSAESINFIEPDESVEPIVRIYILCHSEDRLQLANNIYAKYPWAVPILMKYQDYTFENAFWQQLGELRDEWLACDMVGTLSFSAYKKIDIDAVDAIIQNPKKWSSGFYHFYETNKPLTNDHPYLLKIVNDVLAQIDMRAPLAAYSNYWMAAPRRLTGFLEWYATRLKPTVIQHPLAMKNSQYRGKLKPQDLKRVCGVPYYPHAPFVLERLTICYFKQGAVLYMIGGVDGGGSLKFIHDFIEQFPQTCRILKKRELDATMITSIDTVVVQHLFDNITATDLCRVQQRSGCRLILNVHDFWWLDKAAPHSAYLAANIKIDPAVKKLFSCAEIVIHPSRFTVEEYSKHFPPTNFVISPHIDFADMESKIAIPPVSDTIRIGAMHEFTECKGQEYINYLMSTFKFYKGLKIEWLVAGGTMAPYKENELFNILKDKQIHCLLLLNKWGETYCYSLSKFLKSGLPILYNAIGVFPDRIPDRPHYKRVFDSTRPFCADAKSLLATQFSSMLDLILAADKEVNNAQIDLTLRIPPVYDFLFNYKTKQDRMAQIYKRIKPFCIYFPQFHRLIENDYNYYPGMTDATNLATYIDDTNSTQSDTPALCPLANYDLSRKELVQKQVETAAAHGIYGFCVYYYWFSHNSLSGSHTIMKRCYDNFFSETYDNFKIYFNWANEDWTKNPSFMQDGTVTISNVYTEEWIRLNFTNLARYFRHPNYYKIDGAPVFSIHHPWFIKPEELEMLERIFTEKCIALGFSGIHILKNSMVQTYDKSFLIAPNYKAHRTSTDYVTYIPEKISADTIHTMFFSFNNAARMYKPLKPYCSQITNVTADQQMKLLINLVNSYKGNTRSELQKLFLINSWNEWGEDMAVEPGMKNGSLYLNMVNCGLMSVL